MNHPSVRSAAPALLVAAVFLVTVELLRATSPLLDRAAADIGVIGASRLALLIFVAPALLGLVLALLRPAPAAAVLVATLVGLRLLAQAQHPPSLLVIGAAAATGIAALVLVVRLAASSGSAVAATLGVLGGTGADLAIRAGYGSWDPVFRPGAGPWLVILVVSAATIAALLAVVIGGAAGTSLRAGRVAVLGPYLGLYVLAYGSAPIVAAHAGVSLPVASIVLIGAVVVTMELVRRVRLPGGTGAIPEPDRWFAGLVALLALAGGLLAGYWLTGVLALVGLVVAGVAAAVLLARALTPRETASGSCDAVPPGAATAGEATAGEATAGEATAGEATIGPDQAVAPRARGAIGFAAAGFAAGLGYVLPVMVYQVHYDLEFPFDNRYALLAVAVLLGIAGLGARPPATANDHRPLAVRPAVGSIAVALALLVPLGAVAVRPGVPEPTQAGDSIRLMSWNVMYGRDHTGGGVDLGALADAVAAVDPDVLLLQEVSRGWPIGGGADLLEYLSRRLALPYVWSPAADGLFGNALLTRLPLTDVEVARLPFLQGPMERSYVAATVTLAGGGQLRLINAHLQHRTENTPTRLVQSEALLAAWGGQPHTVIAGDFNFWPSWTEAKLWGDAGFGSAQDLAGLSAAYTVPSDDPDNRVDWVFGTPDVSFSGFAILDHVTTSDHLPLVVTVELR